MKRTYWMLAVLLAIPILNVALYFYTRVTGGEQSNLYDGVAAIAAAILIVLLILLAWFRAKAKRG